VPSSEHVMTRGRLRGGRVAAVSLDRTLGVSIFCLALLLGLLLAGSAGAESPRISARKWDARELRAQPGGQQMIDRELRREAEYNRRWRAVHELLGPQHVSRLSQESLARRGLGPALLAGDGRRDMSKVLEPDVLRVLLVRVSFEANRDSHLTTISPGGDFMLDPLADPGPLEIDPPPHDKAFFEAHLAGLSQYYNFMSGGRLQIEGHVLPEGDNDSYTLSDIADYGPGAGNFWSLESLEALVRDVITVSDQGLVADGGNGLADYDDETPFTYVIFMHAGSDWQSDINGDSPNDIPTFFVRLGEPVDLIGTNPQGNPGRLGDCSIIPETTNQDDYPGSIAAAFYHEFGHALGLPDVYSTASGLPSVGIWDLMDSGTNLPATLGTEVVDNGDTTIVVVTATGVLPPSLSVWCKWFLGWLEMGEISAPVAASGDYILPAIGVPRDHYERYSNGHLGDFDLAYPQAYRAGSSPREYFLLENRWVPGALSETPFSDLRLERDEDTQVIQYLAGLYKENWENSGLYDFFMPAGGLLIWHVNADRIASELPSNTINIYGDGLRLVEADGIQDIGVLDAYVQGWFGSWRDLYGGYDPDGMATGFTELYTQGTPTSRNFDRSVSGLRLTGIGPESGHSLATMKFRATLDPILPGFPWSVAAIDSVEAAVQGGLTGPRVITVESPTAVSVAGEQILVFADEPGPTWGGGPFDTALFGLASDGTAVWPQLADSLDGAFLKLGAALAGAPLALPAGGQETDLIWCTTAGVVGSSRLTLPAAPRMTWSIALSDSLVTGPLALQWPGSDRRILLAAYPDSLYLLDQAGLAVGSALRLPNDGGEMGALRMAVLPADGDGADRAAVFTASGWFVVSQAAGGLVGEPEFVSYAGSATPGPVWNVVVPLGAGRNRVRVFDGDGEIGSWDVAADGTVTTRGPGVELDGPLVCAPAVADVDGDGRQDVILATGTRIYGQQRDGLALRGFPVRFADLYPLPDSVRITGPLVVADGTGDGANEVFFNTNGGHLVGLGPDGRLLPNLPLRWGDWSAASLSVGGEGLDRVLWLVSSGGSSTGYLDRIPINGRVTAYALTGAPAASERTSEWLGAAGGSTRRGPTGTARDLGLNAPINVEKDQVYLYPNPLSGDDVRIRFYVGAGGDAAVAIYNLEGELVTHLEAATEPDAINEIVIPLPGVASGLYLARLQYEGPGGPEIRTLTLAVEK